jgi:peptide/nickel transport system permease protein
MLAIVLRRVALAVPLLLIVMTLSFLLVHLTPGDPAASILGDHATPAQYAQVTHQLGLDQPLLTQYVVWLGRLCEGQLGNSLYSSQPVSQAIGQRLPVTLSLTLGATLIGAIAGIACGAAAAIRGGLADRAIQAVAALGIAVPNFWLGLGLVLIFADSLHAFPPTGYTAFSASPQLWAQDIVLPLAALSAACAAAVARQARGAMLDVLNQPWVTALRSQGIPERSVLLRHSLRAASGPVVTQIALQFVGLLSGAIIVEQVFALPGLGSLAIAAVNQHDLPTIQGVVLVMTLLVIAVNLLTDLVYAWLRPQVRS